MLSLYTFAVLHQNVHGNKVTICVDVKEWW